MKTFQIKSIFFLLKCIVVSYSIEEDIKFVYSQLPREQINLETGEKETSTCYEKSSTHNIIFLCKGNNTIILFREDQTDQIIEQKFDFQVTSLSLFKDGIHILIGNSQRLYLFKYIVEEKTLNQLLTKPVLVFYTVVKKVIFNKEGSIAYVFGVGGYISAYDSNFIELSDPYITKSAITRSAQLLQDESFILFSDDQNGILIFKIIFMKNNRIQFHLAGNNSEMGWIYNLQIKKDESILFGFNVWRGVQYFDLSKIKQDLQHIENYPLFIPYKYLNWPIENMVPNVYCGELSQDEQFLYLGVRSHGILIFDVKNIEKPLLLQQIYVQGHSLVLSLTGTENNIIYSNSMRIYIFEKIQPNLNSDFPNFFNMHQSQVIPFQQSSPFKWRCYIKENPDKTPNSWYAYLALDNVISGLKIEKSNQFTYNVEETWNITFSTSTYADSLAFTQTDNIMYIPIQEEGDRILDVYNITNKSIQPQFKTSLIDLQQKYHAEQIYASGDFIIMSYDTSILLIENSNLDGQNMKVVVRYEFQLPGSCVGAFVTKDQKYLIGALRDYGLVVVDINDKDNPFRADNLQTFGAESLFPSQLYDLVYVSDGMSGFKILDLSYLPKIKVIGQYQLPGWTNHIELTPDENYAIVSTMDYGMITLLDICNKNFPVLLQKFQILNESAQSTCIQKDLTFGFIMNQNPIKMLPLKSQLILNTEIALINSQQQIQTTKQRAFYVGQQILIHFTPLYINESGKITSIKLYSKTLGTTSDLPSYMKLQENGDIIFKIDKFNLSEENTNNSPISTVTLIVELQTQLSPRSFVQNFNENSQLQLSEQVFNFLILKGCLDKQRYLLDSCKKQQILIPNSISTDQEFIEYVNNKLSYSYFYNPVIIRISSSLQFDQTNPSQMIKSLSEKVILIMTIQNNGSEEKSKFITKQYDNLILSYNSDQSQIRLEGSLTAINKVIENKIVIFTKNKNDNIQLQLQDNINYELDLTIPIQQALFLEIKQNLIIQIPIQDQIESIYDDARIYVYEPFTFNIDRYTFYDKDQIKLTYQAYYLFKGKYIGLDSSTWIKFDQDNFKLYGIPPYSSLFSTIYLKIVADNQNSQAEQYFHFNISRIPFSFVIYLILQVLGPLAFLFSLYKIRINFFNALYRKRTVYSNEVAYVNQIYTKKILIVGDQMKIAKLFFQKFLDLLKKEKISQKKKWDSENQSRKFSTQNINQITSNFLKFKNNVNSLSKQLQDGQQLDKSVQERSESELIKNCFKSMNDSQQESFDNQRNSAFAKIASKVLSNITIQQSNLKGESNSSQLNTNQQITAADISKDKNQLLKLIKIYPNLEIQDERYLLNNLVSIDQEKSISFDVMMNKLIEMNIQIRQGLKKYNINQFKDQLMDSNSLFHMCIKTCAVKYISLFDKKIQYLLSYMLKCALKYNSYTHNDWYKAYLEINGQNLFNQKEQLLLFPKIDLKIKPILSVFQKLNLFDNSQNDIRQINKFGISFEFLKLSLEITALGLDDSSCMFMKKCSGESIHEKLDFLLSIEAYKINEQSKFKCLSKWINNDYKRLPLSKNMSLPSWMSYDCKQGILILEGIPQQVDQEQILIRVLDVNHYILLQYFLKITVKGNNLEPKEKNEFLSELTDQPFNGGINGNNNIQNQISVESSTAIINKKDYFLSSNSQIRLNKHLKSRKETFLKQQILSKMEIKQLQVQSSYDLRKQDNQNNGKLKKTRSYISCLEIEDEMTQSQREQLAHYDIHPNQQKTALSLNNSPQMKFMKQK